MYKQVVLIKDLKHNEPRIVGIYAGIMSASKKIGLKFKKEGFPGIWMTEDDRYIATKYSIE